MDTHPRRASDEPGLPPGRRSASPRPCPNTRPRGGRRAAAVVATGSVSGEGLDVLTATVTGTTVLPGPSGAGKSTPANALPGEDRMDTAPVRAADGKGRHTTVHREPPPMPHGDVLIDTPGLRGTARPTGERSGFRRTVTGHRRAMRRFEGRQQ
ncbi:GTPase RsgA [Streptomyces sp. AV19]|uniref:GTPase RsgA n=1 Tax=Streptomyces sp. AV19 TaxID=2793068 RepID=UPI0018FEABC7|nr:GTPase RsgA [Streptomyces sp. AV19]MBH1934306.1 GTPase RsgA [Streptomyces sp. AV19]